MKRLWLFMAVLFVLNGCSLIIPNLLDGNPTADSGLAGLVFINEVSADNSLEDDWVELYNSSASAVDLSGFYLSDDPVEVAKWSFPGESFIMAGSYLVVVCDGSGSGGKASFKLSPGTDQVVLMTPDLAGIVDSLSSILFTNTGSYGRSTDGGETWTTFPTPTRGGANS